MHVADHETSCGMTEAWYLGGFLASEGDKRTKMQKGIVNAVVYIDTHKVLQSVTDIFGPEICASMS